MDTVTVRVASDGKYCPCPVIETVDTLLYDGHFDYEFFLDFPMEALAFPRLEGLQFRWVNVRSIPPEILKVNLKWLCTQKVQEPPLFLVESECQIEWAKPFYWGSIEDQLKPFRHLRQLLLLGLGEENPSVWSFFLKLHRLHDPRLFLFVAEFLK